MLFAYDFIDLKVSDAAADALTQELRRLPFRGVVGVQWGLDLTTQKYSWDVGFYERKDVPREGLQEIRGIPFVFNQGPLSKRLSGKLLDNNDSGFVVIDPVAGAK
jgi:hypothetical protein